MNIIVVSNSCVGWSIYEKLKSKYNSPFIGTMIPSDDEYLKLCNNLIFYMSVEPICNITAKNNTTFAIQSGSPRYQHQEVSLDYPIIHLNDIEVHCVHEKDCGIALDKFNRRRERMLNIIATGQYMIFNTWSYGDLFVDHVNISSLIFQFLNIETDHMKSIFLGSSSLKIEHPNYLTATEWDHVDVSERTPSHTYRFNDQRLAVRYFHQLIKPSP